jgi:hypothetical protein
MPAVTSPDKLWWFVAVRICGLKKNLIGSVLAYLEKLKICHHIYSS